MFWKIWMICILESSSFSSGMPLRVGWKGGARAGVFSLFWLLLVFDRFAKWVFLLCIVLEI